MARPLRQTSIDMDRFDLAASDSVEDGLTGDAHGLGRIGQADPSLGDLRDDPGSHVGIDPDAPRAAGNDLFPGDEPLR